MATCRVYETELINTYLVGYTNPDDTIINNVVNDVLDILCTSSKYRIDKNTKVYLINCKAKDSTNITLNIDCVYSINEEQDTYMVSKLSINDLIQHEEDIISVINEEMGVVLADLTHHKYDLNMYAKQYMIGSINTECADIKESVVLKFDSNANIVYGYFIQNLYDIDKIVNNILEKFGGRISPDTLIYMGVYHLNDNSYKSEIDLLKIISKDGGYSCKILKDDNYKLPYVVLNKKTGFADCNRIKYNGEVYYKDYGDIDD